MNDTKESTDYLKYPNFYKPPVVGVDGWTRALARFCTEHGLDIKRHENTWECRIYEAKTGTSYYTITRFPKTAIAYWLRETEIKAERDVSALYRTIHECWRKYHEAVRTGDRHE